MGRGCSSVYKELKALIESYDEACGHIEYLASTNDWLSEEIGYLKDFISYKGLNEEYDYFRRNAYREDDPEEPFPKYIL